MRSRVAGSRRGRRGPLLEIANEVAGQYILTYSRAPLPLDTETVDIQIGPRARPRRQAHRFPVVLQARLAETAARRAEALARLAAETRAAAAEARVAELEALLRKRIRLTAPPADSLRQPVRQERVPLSCTGKV